MRTPFLQNDLFSINSTALINFYHTLQLLSSINEVYRHHNKTQYIRIYSLYHSKMLQCILNCFSFLFWTLRLSGIFRFRQVIIHPLNKVADFQSALFQNTILNFLISGFTLHQLSNQIHQYPPPRQSVYQI